MIDYLEPLEGESADALREALRRAEALPAAGPSAAGETTLEYGAEAKPARGISPEGREAEPGGVSAEDGPVYRAEGETPGVGEEPGPEVPPSAGEEAAPPPLLEQLEALEGALAGAGRLERESASEPERRTAGFSLPAPGQRGGFASPAGAEGTDLSPAAGGRAEPGAASLARLRAARPSWGEETVRAEELDRALQRDSRRYDGGFFMY